MQLKPFMTIGQRQQGLITRRQALEVCSLTQLAYLIRSGKLISVRPKVYRLWGSSDTWEQRLLAITLSAPDAVVSHRSAARLWQLGNHWKNEIVEVSTTHGSGRRYPDTKTRQTQLPEHHITFLHGIRTTTLARTIVDLAATSPGAAIERALDHALSMRWTTIAEVSELIDETDRPGRPRMRTIKDIISARREHLSHSDLEREAFHLIRSSGLPLPVSQHTISTQRCDYAIDLAYPAELVGIECDGYVAHGQRTQFDSDARRSSSLSARGWRILRYTSRTCSDEFVADLRLALRVTHPSRDERIVRNSA